MPQNKLLAQADELCQDPAFRRAVWRHCTCLGQTGALSRFSTRIHRNDQMLQFPLKHFGEANRSLSQYFNIALQQHAAVQQLLQGFFAGRIQDRDVLDFACGYGRLLRFLSLSVPPTRLWASEIQREAVDFVVQEFGVKGILSDVDPGRFNPGKEFDFVWVASLFSHLPEPLFHQWLRRLISILKPGGVLCFSVHDETVLPKTTPMPQNGIYYVPGSENDELDKSVYGTTFVSEPFVGSAIREASEKDHPFCRLKRGLANHQDIYVVPKDRDDNLDRLSSFRKGPWGCVDVCRVSESGDLLLSGWTCSLDDGQLGSVTITINDRSYSCPTGLSRDDVRKVLGDERLAAPGWEFRHSLREEASPVFVEVSVRAAPSEVALLYAGRLTVP